MLLESRATNRSDNEVNSKAERICGRTSVTERELLREAKEEEFGAEFGSLLEPFQLR